MAGSIDGNRVLRFRAVAGHLTRKLPPTELAVAARSGLQDSAPRSGVISLHARVGGLAPSAWEDPALAQVWGPRGAVYIVPRADMHVFTLGRLPRDRGLAQPLLDLSDAVCAAVGDGKVSGRVLVGMVDVPTPNEIRWSAVSGRIGIRWDCRDTAVYALEEPPVDAETARLELARRYLSALGPGTADSFAKWAGILPDEAGRTFAALSAELAAVGPRYLLGADLEAWEAAGPVEGVRLLPAGDPFLYPDRRLLAANAEQFGQLFRSKGSIPGGLFVGGRIAGTWQRQQGKVTLEPWEPLEPDTRAAITHEAATIPLDVPTKSVFWGDEMSP